MRNQSGAENGVTFAKAMDSVPYLDIELSFCHEEPFILCMVKVKRRSATNCTNRIEHADFPMRVCCRDLAEEVSIEEADRVPDAILVL